MTTAARSNTPPHPLPTSAARHPLPTSAPSTQGVDAVGVMRFLDAIEGDPAQEPHGLMVLKHGHVIAQGWWAPHTADRPQLVYSLSKSFTSAAAGLMVDAGLLDLDAPVISYFPEWAGDIVDERSRRLRVRDVAAMASGHDHDMFDEVFIDDPAIGRPASDDPVRTFLLCPPAAEPGTLFAYNQPCTYTLGALVERVSGQPLVDIVRTSILQPLGAQAELSWQHDAFGRAFGYSGAFVTTDTIARLGQVLLQGGSWNGARILSPDWVAAASSRQVATATGPLSGTSDWELGYGFQHWISRHGFRGDGAYGQLCLVLPEHDAVVAFQGASQDMQQLLDHVWSELLPALAGAKENAQAATKADTALAARLGALRLPARTGTFVAAVSTQSDAEKDAFDDATFTEPAAGSEAASARTFRDGDGTWWLELVGSTGPVRGAFRPGSDEWTVTEGAPGDAPTVAISGGFASPTRLDLDVSFLESPHRLRLSLERVAGVDPESAHARTPAPESAAPGILHASWQTAPLWNPRDLRTHAAPAPAARRGTFSSH